MYSETSNYSAGVFVRLAGQLLAILFITLAAGPTSGATLPAGFSEATINGPAGSTWNEAVGMLFEDNGRMYVWERGGTVWIKEPGSSTWSLLIDIGEEVGWWRDFGLLGFALDPNFRVNGYIYLLYVVDRHHLMNFGTGAYSPTANEYFAATIGRITRYTARSEDGFRSVDYSSRRVLLGETRNSGPAILHESHGTGSLLFGTDGTLLASFGDGASYATTDAGSASETYYSRALADGIIRPKENVGSFRSQMVDSLSGKVVRIDPATGDGIPSNPYYDPANPRAARSRVWALGLRNPYRMTLRPGTGSHNRADGNPGVLYIGDVGWGSWEDLNVCTGPRQNFGWPNFEGIQSGGYNGLNTVNQDAPNPLYPAAGCAQYFSFRDLIKQNTSVAANQPPFDNPCNTSQNIPGSIPQFLHTPPVIDWFHGSAQARTWIYNASGVATPINIGAAGSPVSGSMFAGNCSVAGVWYTGTDFPAQYRNTYFHADFGVGWIRNFVFTTNDRPVSVASFASSSGPVLAVATHPTEGGLYYLAYNAAETATVLRKVSYSASGNSPPTARASADRNYGPGPLTVQFTGNSSSDPEGLPLTYTWNFGDGTPTSTAANPVHVFNAPAGVPTPFTVTLTVRDSIGQTSTTTLLISVNNTPPVVTITSPINGTKYPLTGPTVYNLTASVTDSEFPDNQLRYEWQTILRHNNHEHPDPIDTNHVTTTLLSPVGCDGNTYFYRIVLRVIDPAGLSTAAEVQLFPDCPNQPPVASFTAAPVSGTAPLTVSFDARASSDPYDDPLTYEWVFGDGATGSGETPVHTYTSAGTFTVFLTVRDPGGLTNRTSRVISVAPTPPLAITTGSLPDGVLNNSYAATLAATGGRTPYTWSVSSGSLPTGLALNGNSGTISGTASSLGTYNFTAQVTDSSSPPQSTNKAFTISVVQTPTFIGNTNDGALTDDMGAGWINAGRYQATANLNVTMLFAKVAGIPGRYKCAVYTDSGGTPSRLLRISDEVSAPPTGWQNFALTSPLSLTNGQFYWLAIWSDNSASKVYYSGNDGTLRWGNYSYGTWPDPFATIAGANANYCIYARGTASNPATLTSISVTPANPTINAGVAQQFTATGTYSDGSTQNLTSQVGWTSSVPAVATINASGLATASAVGNTTISATLGTVSGNTLLTVQPPPLTIATASLPNGTVGNAYNATLSASGGTQPYTWSIITGALPAGLELNTASGAITGNPAASGTANFTVQVRDSSNPAQTTTRALSITVNTTLISISVTPVNPIVVVGNTLQFTATGTYSDGSSQNLTSQVNWTSSVPAVATISAAGLASAIAVGNSTISATLGSVSGNTALTVEPPPLTITTSSLPGGAVNQPYNASIIATGGTTPYTWSLLSGGLPSGLVLNSANGAISGTPTAAGTSNFTVQVRDSRTPAQSTNRAFSIQISAAPTFVGNTNDGTLLDDIGSGWINAGRYQATANLTASSISAKVGAIPGRYKCAIYTDSSGVPSRLLRTTAEITGPTAGWKSFALTSPLALTNGQFYWLAIWSDHPNARVFYSGNDGTLRWGNYAYGTWPDPFSTIAGANANYCIYAVGTPVNPATLTSIAVTPANSTVNMGGTQQFTATGTYSDGSTQNLTSQVGWTSSVPAVATINAAGLATSASVGDTTISATLGSVSGSTLLTVQPAPLTITTTSLPNGTVNAAYNASVSANGGTAPYAWAIITGGLPTGLSLDPNTGAITGTPTTSGTSNFTVRATDSAAPAQTATRSLSITVNATLTSITVTPVNPSITAGATLQFTATGTYSDGGSQNLTSQVGWTSSVPAVASVSANGLATGSTVGSTVISATLNGVSGTTLLTVQPPPLTITTATLPGGTVNQTFNATLSANGGTTPYSWSIISGGLPAGLILNSGSGLISGTPSTAGTSNFTVQVSDSAASPQTASRALSIQITSVPAIIGNTNDGTLTDDMGAGWINAGRYQATANLNVTTMFAKVGGIPGRYKCAIYTDGGGVPSRLLRASAEVTAPATGWQTFPLTSSLALTNGQFYWLAIWSDHSNSKVYYSGSNGALRWGNYAYGTWPDPFTTIAGASVNYSIYASGTPPAAGLAAASAGPEPTVLSIALREGTVTIEWNAIPGTSYVLEYKDDPTGENWQQSPAVLAVSSTGSVTTSVRDAKQRFYRIRVAP